MDRAYVQPPKVTTKGVTIAAVTHAIDILRCISMSPEPLGINEIARRLGLHKSSISRLVATLAAARLVEREDPSGRIKLGTGLVLLAAPILSELRIRDLVRPALLALAAKSGETASYNIWDGSDAVTIEQVPGPGAVRIFAEPGRHDPGHCTACGKILLAYEPAEVIDAYCKGDHFKRYNDRTITVAAELKAELAIARQRGYALNMGELESDVSAISAAVRDTQGIVVGSVTLTVPSYRFAPERQQDLIAMVVDTAQSIFHRMN